MRVRVVGLAAVVSVLCWINLAVADPIVITSGHAYSRWDAEPVSFELNGDGTHIRAATYGPPAPRSIRAGETVVLRTFLTTINSDIAHHPVSATVNGTFYPSAWLFGRLDFLGAPFVAPPAKAGEYPPYPPFDSLRTTFVMNGHLEGYADIDQTIPLFTTTVTGSGLASVSGYRAFEDNVWSSYGIDGGAFFEFTPENPSPTPEPASLVLFATGLVAVAGRKLRRTA